jgi:UDP-N-acetylglucosamine--N-acetylmuramyl-(pentapeptide) pyrophosphoryl-undecaprenol N-acetylglucosamine transferase
VTNLVADPRRLAATAAAARRSGHAGADETLARVVLEVAGTLASERGRT